MFALLRLSFSTDTISLMCSEYIYPSVAPLAPTASQSSASSPIRYRPSMQTALFCLQAAMRNGYSSGHSSWRALTCLITSQSAWRTRASGSLWKSESRKE